MKAVIQNFRLSLGFLTLIPVGDIGHVGKGDLSRSLYTFPVVGLLIGALCVAAGFASQYILASPLHVISVLVVASIITGGLHLDGLADTFDGICSWRPRNEKLKIMKDSRIGVMGALVLIFVLLGKYVSLAALDSHWWLAALLAPMWGRWAAFYNLHFFPRAESDGLAANIESGSRLQFLIATAFTLSVSLFTLSQCGVPLIHQLALLSILWLFVHLIARKISRSLGGVTGDTCGALSELTELLMFLALGSPLFALS